MRRSVVYLTLSLILLFTHASEASTEECELYFRENVFQGDPLTVYIRPVPDDPGMSVTLRDSSDRVVSRARPFTLELGENLRAGAAVLAVSITLVPGRYTVQAETATGATVGKSVTIGERPYPEERIELNAEMTALRSTPDPKKDIESERLYALLIGTDPTAVFQTERFVRPVSGFPMSSTFGSRRVFAYSTGATSVAYHYGNDFAVPVGTPVVASGRGRVVFAESRILTGNTVVLEHLPSVYTLYYHLESLSVNTGDAVEAGDLLGRSGKTGLVTGPHLHFEFRIGGIAVEPSVPLNSGIIDKDFIISIIHADETLKKGR